MYIKKYTQNGKFRKLERNSRGRFSRLNKIVDNFIITVVGTGIIMIFILGLKAQPVLSTDSPTIEMEASHVTFCLQNGTSTECNVDKSKIVDIIVKQPDTVKAVLAKAPTYHATYSKKYSKEQLAVASKIVEIAKAEKFEFVSYLLALADCESSFIPSNKNTKGNKPSWSTDLGILMYNDWHQRKNITKACSLDLTCAIKHGIADIRAGKQKQWMCDRIIKRENRVPFYASFVR